MAAAEVHFYVFSLSSGSYLRRFVINESSYIDAQTLQKIG